ncbi:MAG TPA: CBS domain-containing protein [Segetibacter sp.]
MLNQNKPLSAFVEQEVREKFSITEKEKVYSNNKINLAMNTVETILKNKEEDANTIEPTAMVIEALQKLISVNLSYLIVVEDGQFKGIFSERDYTRKLVLQGRSSRDTMVSEVMTTELPEVDLENTVEDCMYQMNARGARYLAAFDGGRFAGIITIHDLLRCVLANKHHIFDNSLTNSLIDNEESGKFF